MKKQFKQCIVILCICMPILGFSQVDSTYVTTELTTIIMSIDFAISKKALVQFIEQNKLFVISQNESKREIDFDVLLNKEKFEQLSQLCTEIGYTTSKNISTVNNAVQVQNLEFEIIFLKKQNAEFTALLQNYTSKESDKYNVLWKEKMQVEQSIFEKERELLKLKTKTFQYRIKITLIEEDTSPQESSRKVTFVNMPGVDYSYMFMENPNPLVSTANYEGYFVKYLFTRGKSFAITGAFKTTDKIATLDTMCFSEFFILGFGQDFYTRYLGRGTRKFLNLYSGYTIGYLYATGKNSKSDNGYIAPCVGLELFKNKYFLFDTKVTYMIPIVDNKHLRGYSFSGSVNFVF